MLGKNRGNTRSGLARFFQSVYAQRIMQDRVFQMPILGLLGRPVRTTPDRSTYDTLHDTLFFASCPCQFPHTESTDSHVIGIQPLIL
jgi:hypothetical protein